MLASLIIGLIMVAIIIGGAVLIGLISRAVPKSPFGTTTRNTSDWQEREQHKEHMDTLKAQTAAMHERNLYERGDSIYSSRHTDF